MADETLAPDNQDHNETAEEGAKVLDKSFAKTEEKSAKGSADAVRKGKAGK